MGVGFFLRANFMVTFWESPPNGGEFSKGNHSFEMVVCPDSFWGWKMLKLGGSTKDFWFLEGGFVDGMKL